MLLHRLSPGHRFVVCSGLALWALWLAFAVGVVSTPADAEPAAGAAVAEKTPENAAENGAKGKKGPRRERPAGRSADRFAPPRSNEAADWVAFVERLEKSQPEPHESSAAFAAARRTAVLEACERIVRIATDEKSESHRFARRRLLHQEIDDRADEDQAIGARLYRQTLAFLAAGLRREDDAQLAIHLCSTLGELDADDQAAAWCEELGRLFADSKDAATARLAQRMAGVARRLDALGKKMEFVGTTLDGRPFDLKSLRGKVVLVDFWTTWCDYCLGEFPNIKRNYLAYKDRGFEVVSVNCDARRRPLDDYRRLNHLPWITLHDDLLGADQQAAVRYGVSSYPTTLLVDRDGTVLSTDIGGRALGKKLKELLGPPASLSNAGGPFPVLNNDELLDRLMDAAEERIEAGTAKDLATLRKQIGRKTCELKLPPPSRERPSEQQLYQKTAESIFILGGLYRADEEGEWEVALATAFAATADGALCTSYHVFLDDLEIQAMVAMDLRGRIYPVEEILAADELTDTCFFRIPAADLRPLAFGDDAAPGATARIVSHPGNVFYFLSAGHVSNYFRDDDGVVWMNVTADFGQGASGAPVIDDRGNVIGQVSRTSTLFASESLEVRGGRSRTDQRGRRSTRFVSGPRRASEPSSPPGDAALPAEPQMVFKSCVPTSSMRRLVVAPK